MAARLAALSEGGSVVISEETRRRLDNAFQVEDMGMLPLRNVAEPIRLYRLRSEELEHTKP